MKTAWQLLVLLLMAATVGCAKPAQYRPMCIEPDIQVQDHCEPPIAITHRQSR